MPFEYTPVKQVEYGDYWSKKAEKTPKADLSQIPSWNEIYSNSATKAAQEARQAEIEASPYAWHGEGLPMPPQEKERWKKEFFKELNHE